jgi:tetratricopeptide (TPR) repeat protein
MLSFLANCAIERGDLEVALDFAQRAVNKAREDHVGDPESASSLGFALMQKADILGWLDRPDEAIAADAEWRALNPSGGLHMGAAARLAMKLVAAGEDAEAEEILRGFMGDLGSDWNVAFSSKIIEAGVQAYTVMAEILERRGTEESLAEAKTLRDRIAGQLTRHEERRAAVFEETRAAAAEAVRQWREERIKAREKRGAKGKKGGKKKGKKGKGKGKKKASSALAIEGEAPRVPAGGEAEAAAAVERGACSCRGRAAGSSGGITAARGEEGGVRGREGRVRHLSARPGIRG